MILDTKKGLLPFNLEFLFFSRLMSLDMECEKILVQSNIRVLGEYQAYTQVSLENEETYTCESLH